MASSRCKAFFICNLAIVVCWLTTYSYLRRTWIWWFLLQWAWIAVYFFPFVFYIFVYCRQIWLWNCPKKHSYTIITWIRINSPYKSVLSIQATVCGALSLHIRVIVRTGLSQDIAMQITQLHTDLIDSTDLSCECSYSDYVRCAMSCWMNKWW